MLADFIARHAKSSGDFPTALSNLTLHRRVSPPTSIPCIYNLRLGVMAQGRKKVKQQELVIDYRAGSGMLCSIDQPVVSHVARVFGG